MPFVVMNLGHYRKPMHIDSLRASIVCSLARLVASANELPIPPQLFRGRKSPPIEDFAMNATLKSQSRIVLAFVVMLAVAITALAAGTLVRLSADIFTNSASKHKTEVEPDTFAWGSTIVSAFQTARVPAGGSADIGFATSTNGGTSWTHGYLPGLTVNYKNGTFSAASDPSVVYDPKHGVWLIESLGIATNGTVDVLVSSSPDGLNWGDPVFVDKSGVDDKNWITCDTTSTSPFYGNCYAEWDQGFSTGEVQMSTSTDGGTTWGPSLHTADSLTGLEANLRFGGPETMESKIFARLTAWQNWIFQRPNATGEAGALTRYGTGRKPEFDTRRA